MATDEVRGTPTVPNAEFLLGLSAERLAGVAKALERNWTVQLVIAGIGFALVFDLGDLPKFLSKYISQDTYDLKPAATILLATLLYHFMKFGHLLTSFIEARRLHDALLSQYLGNVSSDVKFKALRETTSFFEGYYSPDAFGGRGHILMTTYYLASAIIISTGQAAALFLILRAYGTNRWSIATITIVAGIMGLLYREFWRSNKNQPGTTALVIASCASAVVLFAIFWIFGRITPA